MDDTTVGNSKDLTSLPLEILSRILTLVEGSDIPTLQRTCKTILSAMRTRQFWYSRIHRLCEEHLVSPPEEELEEYTIAELGRWTMQRIPVRSGVPTNLKTRYLRGSDMWKMGERAIFIPGGRWLLVIYWEDDVVVNVFDLDGGDDLIPLPLLNLMSVNPSLWHCPVIETYVWVDHEAPRLAFRFAASLSDVENHLHFDWMFIYQVNLIGHGASATLVAPLIATFRTPMQNGSCCSGALNDHYYIRNVELSPDSHLEIFDYEQALGRFDFPSIGYHTFPIEEFTTLGGLEFINKDICAAHCLDAALHYIFSIESPTSIKVLHIIHKRWLARSRTSWTPGASLMTLIEPKECDRTDILNYLHPPVALHGLVIPHDSRLHPRTIELDKYTRRENAYFKLGKSISLLDSQMGLSYVGHEWDPTSLTSCGRVYTVPTLGQRHNFRGFDEDTGRSLYRSDEGLCVVDIVLAAN